MAQMTKDGALVSGIVERINHLDAAIAAADEEQRGRYQLRKRLVAALKVLKEVDEMGDGRGKGGKAENTRGARVMAARGNSTADSLIGEKMQTMADVINSVVREHSGEFTTTMIVEALKRRHADVFAKLPANYVSTRLWWMTKKKIVRIVKPAESGGINTYALEKQKPAA